jgi:hypothetical protein
MRGEKVSKLLVCRSLFEVWRSLGEYNKVQTVPPIEHA